MLSSKTDPSQEKVPETQSNVTPQTPEIQKQKIKTQIYHRFDVVVCLVLSGENWFWLN